MTLLFILPLFYSVTCIYQHEKQINMHLCPTESNPIPFPETNPLRRSQSKQRNQSNKVADVFIGEPWTEVLIWASGHGCPDLTQVQSEPEF